MARPRINIPKKEFEKLCALQCTLDDIAGFFDCSEDTIERWCQREYGKGFAEIFKQKRKKGIVSLRKSGFDMAKNNPSVHIFYAKNYLGMKDQVIYEDTEAIDVLKEILSQNKENAKLRTE